jgi:ABC-type uncharacterized transport system permease subunit
MTARTWLWLALAVYAAGGALTWQRLRGGSSEPLWHRLNLALMLTGFVLHTMFLAVRGQALHRCPLTNLFEVQVFVAWAAVLFYLLIGAAYRVTLLGAFTAPVVLALGLSALLSPIDVARELKRSPWVEFHAGIGILAWGAFAVAGVVSVMYLLQERRLKRREVGPVMFLLPALDQLDVVAFRLLILGFALDTVGMVGGMVSTRLVGHWGAAKTAWAIAVWLGYGALVALRARSVWRGHRFAVAVLGAFVVTVVAFWAAQ